MNILTDSVYKSALGGADNEPQTVIISSFMSREIYKLVFSKYLFLFCTIITSSHCGYSLMVTLTP